MLKYTQLYILTSIVLSSVRELSIMKMICCKRIGRENRKRRESNEARGHARW